MPKVTFSYGRHYKVDITKKEILSHILYISIRVFNTYILCHYIICRLIWFECGLLSSAFVWIPWLPTFGGGKNI